MNADVLCAVAVLVAFMLGVIAASGASDAQRGRGGYRPREPKGPRGPHWLVAASVLVGVVALLVFVPYPEKRARTFIECETELAQRSDVLAVRDCDRDRPLYTRCETIVDWGRGPKIKTFVCPPVWQ